MKYGIFTKPIHVEKIVNFLNQYTDIDYIISTDKNEVCMYNFNIGVSYCFPFKINICDKPWFNYHPAPLPKYKGLSNYSKPISDKVKHFGVTLHKMSNVIDNGDVILVKNFSLGSVPVTTNELGCITHYYLFQLFKETIEKLEDYV